MNAVINSLALLPSHPFPYLPFNFFPQQPLARLSRRFSLK